MLSENQNSWKQGKNTISRFHLFSFLAGDEGKSAMYSLSE